MHEHAICQVAQNQANSAELKNRRRPVSARSSADRDGHALSWSRQLPAEDKSTQAQIADVDRAEADYVPRDSRFSRYRPRRLLFRPEHGIAVSGSRQLTQKTSEEAIERSSCMPSIPIPSPMTWLILSISIPRSSNFDCGISRIRCHADATSPSHPTAATLLRLQLPSLLKDVDRVVYLDCDLVVLKDITTLYDTDLLDFPLAACLDFWLTGGPPFAPPIAGLGS